MRIEYRLRRLVSLMLALLLSGAPLTMAAAAFSDEPQLQNAEELVPGEDAVELAAEEWRSYSYQLGYGVAVNDPSGLFALMDYDRYFAVETAAERYGYRDYTSDYPFAYDDETGNLQTFCVFPSDEEVGRVPDQKFAGWYLIPADMAMEEENEDEEVVPLDPWVWRYAEGMAEMKLGEKRFPYGENGLSYSEDYYGGEGYGSWGDSWDRNPADPWTAPDYSAYGYEMLPTGWLDTDHPVRFVGRWAASDVANAFADGEAGARLSFTTQAGEAAQTPQLYTTDIAGGPLTDFESGKTDFQADVYEYWLRVGADVDMLDLVFNAAEPYYEYNTTGEGPCPVVVTNTFACGTADCPLTRDAEMLPAPTKGQLLQNVPQNTTEDPAHSQWTVEDIRLEPSAGGKDLYNDVVVSVTAPDGVTTVPYTFHIQRLAEPALTQNPGNTPVGMIARDTSVVWGVTEAERQANKSAAAAYFRTNSKFDSKFYPQDSQNQGGNVFRDGYSAGAWLGENVDWDPNAIVVYQDTAFLDPGIALTDAEGNPVTLGEGAYAGTVTRMLKLRRAGGALTLGDVHDGGGLECWYGRGPVGGAFYPTQTSETILLSDGSDQIDLRELKVLPGIYSLEYTYTDPVSEIPYSALDENSGFTSLPENGEAFHRTLVVLPAPGDADMDGAVTTADATALARALTIQNSVGTALGGADLSTDQTAALFAYRVCDINHSGTLRQDDITALEGGFSPLLNQKGDSDYYYLPLPTGESGERYTRTALKVGQEAENAKLTMEFLGREHGRYQSGSGVTIDPSGPDWAQTTSADEKIVLGDTFWLGVKLTDAQKNAMLNRSIDTFTFTLTYDSGYVQPAVVLGDGSAGADHLERWKRSMRIYNLGERSETLWGTDYRYDFTAAAGDDKAYTTHYSKAITPLEAQAGQDGSLRELIFSIKLDANQTPATLKEGGWLFAVPFTLIKHPYGQSFAQLVEMGAGMQDFVFVGRQNAPLLLGLFGAEASDAPAAAYSTQDAIFGGATVNLKSGVSYTGAGAAIPLGEDKTETTTLFNQDPNQGYGSSSTTNAKYSAYFYNNGGGTLPANGRVQGTLPPGLEYKVSEIKGTPTAAGTYDFSIAGNPYRIVVEKAEIRFWADNQATYYGQPEEEFRGEQNPRFTFSYRTDDICSLDRARADRADDDDIVLDGIGANLPALLGYGVPENIPYTPPQFTAVTADGDPVGQDTGVGVYAIRCDPLPESQNYRFVYEKAPSGDQGLNILKRPFMVTKLADGTVVGEIYSDAINQLFGCEAELDGGAGRGFVAELAHDAGDPEGVYKGRPLTPISETLDEYQNGLLMPGDALKLTYSAKYLQTEEDKKGENYFTLAEGVVRELRDVEISRLSLVSGENASNYILMRDRPTTGVEPGKVTGWVLRRSIETLTIDRLPKLTYTHGTHFYSQSSLNFTIWKGGSGGKLEKEPVEYGTYICEKYGISATWATEEQKEAGLEGDISYEEECFTVKRFNGRYICLSAPTLDKEGNPAKVIVYSDTPLTVTPRTLTLTAKPVERYYGEENGALEFTYDTSALALSDRNNLPFTLTGEGTELVEILKDYDYTPPTLEAVVSAANRTPIDASTPYSGGKNAVLIYGAQCGSTDSMTDADGNYSLDFDGCYIFRYALPDGGYTQAEPGARGESAFMIQRRMIVLDELLEKENLTFVYADTKSIVRKGVPLSLENASISLPTHTADSTSYFPLNGTYDPEPQHSNIGYADGAPAILPGDADKLSFTYTATVIPTDGQDYVHYSDFARGYYDMSDADENGEKVYPVQAGELAIVGAAANNYALVYSNMGTAVEGIPTKTYGVDGVAPQQGITNYFASGTGTVRLRPIESIEIRALPRMDYTYGITFNPSLHDRKSLKVALNYTCEGDNYDGNTTSEVVEYMTTHYDLDTMTPISTFDDRSLVIYYVKAGEQGLTEAQLTPERTLTRGQYLTVTQHDNVRLAVAGRRGINDALCISEPSTEAITVAPLPLTLTAMDQARCYGEPNGTFVFNFDETALAEPDQQALAGKGLTGKAGSEALQALAAARGFAYTAPTITTTATQGSDVLSGGKGSYPIAQTGGALSNYKLSYVDGALHIYPRPVKIDHFVDDPERPIYTIYADTTERSFETDVDKSWYTLELPFTGPIVDDEDLPITGAPLYGDDDLALRLTVFYYALPEGALPEGAASMSHSVRVTRALIVPGSPGAGNYALEKTSGNAVIVNNHAQGAVELRSIKGITVKTYPGKLEYTYGESLDLSGLVVTILYDKINGVETEKSEEVVYRGAAGFAQYGLYVNYTSSPTPPSDNWNSIKDTYRKAESGDHLTVAPTHDSQVLGAPFSANGKYLIVSALRHEEQYAAAPQVVQTPIKVNPMALTFTLAADDKTYDGTTQAVGTLALTNAYTDSGYVDQYHPTGVTDMVYPVTGADYESSWGTLPSGYTDFQTYLAQHGGRYAFTTGRYVPAGPAPLGENYPLELTTGYVCGGEETLSFDFLDPNVAYEADTGHDSYGTISTVRAQARGIVLAGPDAANYTIAGVKAGEVTSITAENAAAAPGYLSGVLPEAAIHKRNRAKLSTEVLPQVEADIHTGVVRLTYPQDLSIIEPDPADPDERHFEYGLQYESADGSTLAQWAGVDGTQRWWDETFFGGEAFVPEVPEGYLPREEDLLKEEDVKEDTIFKGQLYRWAGLDGRFVIDEAAYPGGAKWLCYDLYQTDRAALPRDTVFFPVIRAAESRNYNASPVLGPTKTYTPELAQDAADTSAAIEAAEETLAAASTEEERAAAQAALIEAQAAAKGAAQAALAALKAIEDAARADAQAECDFISGLAEAGKWPEDNIWPVRAAAPAVKSYTQRLDLVSTDSKRSAAEGEQENYTIPTLEAVWFTDMLDYPDVKVMDVAVRNNEPTRYYGYAWDSELSIMLAFDDKEHPFSLREAIPVEMKRRDENGQEITETVLVNENNTALIYVAISASGSGMIPEKSLRIEPRILFATVGDAPYQLTAVITPRYATFKKCTWTSSDPAVATVDYKGLVTFVGPGTATITAVSRSKLTDSITVTVAENWRERFPDSVFDLGRLDQFFSLEEGFFYPELGMTRGGAVELLAGFYMENANWAHSGDGDFPDLTGEESYAAAARLLGSLGVVTGTADGNFDGERLITRAEFITLLTRMLGIGVPDTRGQSHAYLDAGEKDTWAYAYIDALNAVGVLQGVGGGLFAPDRIITKVEAAALLTRVLHYGVDPTARNLLRPADVDGDAWGYASILRAINGAEPEKP